MDYTFLFTTKKSLHFFHPFGLLNSLVSHFQMLMRQFKLGNDKIIESYLILCCLADLKTGHLGLVQLQKESGDFIDVSLQIPRLTFEGTLSRSGQNKRRRTTSRILGLEGREQHTRAEQVGPKDDGAAQ